MTFDKIDSSHSKFQEERKKKAEESIKRNLKDSVFTLLFREKKYLLELYKVLHPEDTKITENKLEIKNIENVILNGVYNDLGFLVEGRLVVLVEAQSTWCPNMPARMLIYYGRLLAEYQLEHSLDLYSSEIKVLPKPEFYVVYSGEGHEEKELKFEDAINDSGESFLQMKVKVLRQTRQSTILDQYLQFFEILKKEIRLNGNDKLKALRNTIKICIERNILAEFLSRARQEIEIVMMEVFKQENAVNCFGAEKEAKGKAEGIAEQAVKQAVTSIQILLKMDMPFSEALKGSGVDKKYYPEVLKHFPEYSKA